MAATPDGMGYWLVASDGGVFSLGDTRIFGSLSNIHLNGPVVGTAAVLELTPSEGRPNRGSEPSDSREKRRSHRSIAASRSRPVTNGAASWK